MIVPTSGHLAMPEHFWLSQLERVLLALMGWGQEYCSMSYIVQSSHTHTIKNYLALNIHSHEVQKLWSRRSMRLRNPNLEKHVKWREALGGRGGKIILL